MRAFQLFKEPAHWWSFADYGAVLDVVERRQAKRVLEFGPGSSTLALIEGGATHIDTVEDDPDWAQVWEERLQQRFPEIVHVHRYAWMDPIEIPSIDVACRYDLALIDGPKAIERRTAAIAYAIARCAAVLVPTEDIYEGFRQTILDLASENRLHVELMETGPLQGAFALLTPLVESLGTAIQEAYPKVKKTRRRKRAPECGDAVPDQHRP